MENTLSRDQIVDLLKYIGTSKIIDRAGKDNIQYTCNIHGESNPSAGVSISKQIFHCFSCHATGGFSWLLFKSLPDEFKSTIQAEEFILTRYGVDLSAEDLSWTQNLKRYDDFINTVKESRFEMPRVKLAPFKSGKETYEYFYDRGFTKQTVKDFMIGRDLVNETVTIPVFWEDDVLAGILGRYIDPNRKHNQRYKIYDFNTGALLYPINKFKVIDDSIILVEGTLDAIWMHQHGHFNTLATFTNSISGAQAEFVKSNCRKVIDMSDADLMGDTATKIYRKRLEKDLLFLTVKHAYPEGKKDPCDCTGEEIEYMLSQKRSSIRKSIPRID